MKNSKNTSSKLTNITLSDTSQFILYNTSNYKAVINNSVSEILTKFVEVIIEYMRFISEKIIMKNKSYYRFIFERGIETLIHVFSVIFYFTKNLELTFYHTQKAYYFYIEFIEQISDDNITFLQLSSRDAILFVYKKTIFDMNNEYKKNIQEPTSEEKIILSTVDSYTHIYKSVVLFLINHNDFYKLVKYENKNEYIQSSCNSIEFISETLNKNKIKSNYIECVYLFITLLDDKQIEILDFFRLLDEFIKKAISKKKIDEKLIKNKIYDSELSNFINNNELNKIVEWIFSD
jgi:hypothetical protein